MLPLSLAGPDVTVRNVGSGGGLGGGREAVSRQGPELGTGAGAGGWTGAGAGGWTGAGAGGLGWGLGLGRGWGCVGATQNVPLSSNCFSGKAECPFLNGFLTCHSA